MCRFLILAACLDTNIASESSVLNYLRYIVVSIIDLQIPLCQCLITVLIYQDQELPYQDVNNYYLLQIHNKTMCKQLRFISQNTICLLTEICANFSRKTILLSVSVK